MFDFGAFPTLYTPRLVLREITQRDAESILRIRGDIRVTRLNTGQPLNTLDEAKDLIGQMEQSYIDKSRLDWGIALKDAPQQGLVGRCGYNYWLRRDRRASIGYDMAYAYWGNGYMTEAVRAMVTFGFEEMALNRIEADTDVENYA